MTGIQYCKWVDQAYPNRYCNRLAPHKYDDLCTTHRGHVDAQVRIFEVAYAKATSNES